MTHLWPIKLTHLTHTEWQRHLSVSYDRVGDMHLKTGDNVAALKAYEESLTIRKKLADLDPTHTEWQRDLAVSYERTGDMELELGSTEKAEDLYEKAFVIHKGLTELDPNVVLWQTSLVVDYVKLSQVQPDKAKQLLTDALTILKKLHADNKLDHEKQGWIPILESAIE